MTYRKNIVNNFSLFFFPSVSLSIYEEIVISCLLLELFGL